MRILIVEDEKIIRNAIAEEVQSTGLFSQVDTAKNGEDALEKVLAQDWEGILLDIMMPKMDGLSFLAAFRAQAPGSYARAVKVVLSGHDDFAFAQKALQQGVEDYLLKPLRPADIRDLAKRIYDMASNRRSAEENRREANKLHRRREASLRQLFWKSALLGENDAPNLEARCAELNIPAKATYRVYLLHLAEGEQGDCLDLREGEDAMAAAVAAHGSPCGLVSVDGRTFALVGVGDEGEENGLSALGKALGPCWICCVGPAVSSLLDLQRSYREAKFLLGYAMAKGRDFLRAEDLETLPGSGQASLPLSDLFRLQTWLRLGDQESIDGYLRQSFDRIAGDPEMQRPDNLQAFVGGIQFICTIALQEKAGGHTDNAYLQAWKQNAEVKDSFLHLPAFEAEVGRILATNMAYSSRAGSSGSSAMVDQEKAIGMDH